jgi:hypothetical protein
MFSCSCCVGVVLSYLSYLAFHLHHFHNFTTALLDYFVLRAIERVSLRCVVSKLCFLFVVSSTRFRNFVCDSLCRLTSRWIPWIVPCTRLEMR